MMTQTVVLKLSDRLYQQLRRAAELAQQPVDRIVAQSLAHSLPPLLEDIPAEYQPDVYPLLQMNTQELLKEAKRVFSAARWRQYEALLATKRERQLRPEEEESLLNLRREADILLLRKSYAAVLLKRRGIAPPTIDQLPEPL